MITSTGSVGINDVHLLWITGRHIAISATIRKIPVTDAKLQYRSDIMLNIS